jgi:hypothetical protein
MRRVIFYRDGLFLGVGGVDVTGCLEPPSGLLTDAVVDRMQDLFDEGQTSGWVVDVGGCFGWREQESRSVSGGSIIPAPLSRFAEV